MHSAKVLYIIGGCSLAGEKQPFRTIEKVWIEKESENRIIVVRNENCGQLIEGKRSPSIFLRYFQNKPNVFVVGGCLGPDNHSNSIEKLKLENNQWKSELLTTKCQKSHSCASFDPMSTKMIIFGGFDTHDCLSSVQLIKESETSGIEPIEINGMLPKLKNSTALQINEREFILFGGWEDEKVTSKIIRRIRFDENFSKYEVDFHGFLPYPIEGHTIVQKGSNVYIIGGFDGCFVVPTIIRYNLETKQSEILDIQLKQKRENHISGIINNKYLVVAAGWDSKQSLKEIEVFEMIDTPPYLLECTINGDKQLKEARNRPSAFVM